ncbi:dihydrodipicolinate synthase/N-acetylneuraminate lyase [Belliella baltica DSM 15883]|uniref:Dihydrodipicolinate synthase/N-acetylneuraminate lyase n=1 Tax=Belliella baltica (strain DSM 15883 / CIP 108006 / LMG 21964 / BA134) TaxID=866536 RepID=I3Z939_BELBD|nr:dihydrodipicolinate synthase family protein [Belliella baltica]AFL85757.1 dihydrodipicolinate synthase/N-acetylneuraminate lyase [Belliella baltica DSM 15883]
MQFQKISGLIAATFSPFDKGDKLNLDLIPKYKKMLVSNQVKGAFICGTTGESSSTSVEEKTQLIQKWALQQEDDFKVIAMVSGTNQSEGIFLAKEANKAGIYGISVNAPYYFKTATVRQLVDFIKPIAAAAPNQALYFYHIPVLTNVNLDMLEFLEIAGNEIENFAGIKYTHNDLMEFNRCLRFKDGKYDVLWGWDETCLAGLAMGAKGAVGSTYNFAAPLYNRIFEEFERGDFENARALQELSIDFISLYAKFGGAATGKAIMNIIGFDCGSFRAPIKRLDVSEIHSLKILLEELGVFEYTAKVPQG